MGCLASRPAVPSGSREDLATTSMIDLELGKARTADRKVFKVLLLGTGESGKSTIFKQMQLLYQGGFSAYELSTYRHVVRRNVVEAMQTLLVGAERFGFRLQGEESEAAARAVMEVDPLDTRFWRHDLAKHIRHLWKDGEDGDDAIVSAYRNRARLQLLDSAAYLFANVERYGKDSFTPTEEDVLRARLRTSGIVEKTFMVKDTRQESGDKVPFTFIDVGGQRNERRKWIHCFENVTAVIFVSSLSEYDQMLYEDEKQNRMHEALNVFDAVCNNVYFDDAAIILFLNKVDLFDEKLKMSALSSCFPQYTGDNSFEDASQFIEQEFLSRAFHERADRAQDSVFVHFTCATDTKNVERVFSFCQSFLLQRNLAKLGLM